MNDEVRKLEPKAMWNHFADLNAVPRASKKETQVIEFARSFGERLGLETTVDQTGNVIIRKPASDGMQDRMTVVLQSHLDMVHQKNNDTEFDFTTEGINMVVDGDWVKADGTTLGADNGIGVASIMTLLASDDIPHPPLEALLTIDEETGMTGAKGLQGGVLNGKILLNLDTEDDDELTIGCAGGVDITATGTYPTESMSDSTGIEIVVKGLTGGHSGMDIHLGRGNANKIMNRILWNAARRFKLRVCEIDGGGLRNAISRESVAKAAIPNDTKEDFFQWFEQATKKIGAEYLLTDPNGHFKLKSAGVSQVVELDFQNRLLSCLYGCLSGIYRMSPEIPDLVQTSNSLARVVVKDGQFTIGCLTRSSVDSERDDMANSLTAILELTGATVKRGGEYSGWKPSPESTIVKLMSTLYDDLFGEKAHVSACHAGLECGIIGTHYPDMEMISFGPNIRGAHSPDERVQISSVQKFWKLLLATLKRIPKDLA
jgi:dipeptidase D